MIRFALVVTVAALVTGCAVGPTYYQDKSTARICSFLMSSPSWNVNRPSAFEELARRGDNCNAYGDVQAATARQDAINAGLINQGAAILSTPPPRPVAPVTCVQNGRTVTCY